MRPQQQNRRMRGRNGGGNNNNNNNNNNNRRGPNPLTRNYESNGPDVKIRGSAQQIAEKYAQLARDAQSSGDRVMAENYLQHAEHYNRIIAAAQAQMPIQNFQQNRDASEDDDEDGEAGDNASGNSQNNAVQNAGGQNSGGQNGSSQESADGQPQPQSQPQPEQVSPVVEAGSGPQPDIEGMPAEVALNPEAAGEGNSAPRSRRGSSDASGEAPKRSRRPRRGERAKTTDDAEAAGSDAGLAATLSRGAAAVQEQPAPEPQASGDATLADAEG